MGALVVVPPAATREATVPTSGALPRGAPEIVPVTLPCARLLARHTAAPPRGTRAVAVAGAAALVVSQEVVQAAATEAIGR